MDGGKEDVKEIKYTKWILPSIGANIGFLILNCIISEITTEV